MQRCVIKFYKTLELYIQERTQFHFKVKMKYISSINIVVIIINIVRNYSKIGTETSKKT